MIQYKPIVRGTAFRACAACAVLAVVVAWAATTSAALPPDLRDVHSPARPLNAMALALLADSSVTITGTVPLTGAPITFTADLPLTSPVTVMATVSVLASGDAAAVTMTFMTAPATGAAGAQPASGAQAGVTAEMCMGCHPHDTVFQATSDYTTLEGYEVNPHVTVDPIEKSQSMPSPHASRQNVVDCLKCHQAHSLPQPAAGEVKEPSIDYCYSCHHTTNFQLCSKCH